MAVSLLRSATPARPAPPVITTLALVAVSGLGVGVLLEAESQARIAGIILGFAALIGALQLTRPGQAALAAVRSRAGLADLAALAVAALLIGIFREEHYAELMIATVLFFAVASLGLNIQVAFAGVPNFAGAAFFSIGAYTAALGINAGISLPLVMLAGGFAAASLGLILLLPVLRTRGHYAALVTIGFGLLLRSFLEVNDVLGGPQGIKIASPELFGLKLNQVREIGGIEVSFYLPYAVLALVLFGLATLFYRCLEGSWMGLALDAVRTDETAASTFGLGLARWKATGFVLGNVLIGMAGAGYGAMNGFVNPNGAGLGESLIMISIVVLGGLGNLWGAVVASILLLVIPEKLQAIQEYKLLLFACLVLAVILFRPSGILPRRVRDLSDLAGWRRG